MLRSNLTGHIFLRHEILRIFSNHKADEMSPPIPSSLVTIRIFESLKPEVKYADEAWAKW